MNSDNRLVTDINVAGHHYVALLDSGYFGLLSKILDSKVSVSELDVGREDVAFESPKVHVLSAEQKRILCFPSWRIC